MRVGEREAGEEKERESEGGNDKDTKSKLGEWDYDVRTNIKNYREHEKRQRPK